MRKEVKWRDGGREWMRPETRRTKDESLDCMGNETTIHEGNREAQAGKNVIEDDYSLDSIG